VSQKPRR
jgi:ribonuclease HI